MKLKRFEILLPLNYNDGRTIEPEKFLETNHELLEQFGALTTDTVEVHGSWKYRGTVFHDRLIRLTIDSSTPAKTPRFLRRYKEILKARFEQIDIWITAHDVELI
jgi:hypothetical protein